MSEMTTVGLDLAKNVFQLHGADASGRAVLRRAQVLELLAGLHGGDGGLRRGAGLGPGDRRARP